jgi:hypothetical protein
MLPATFFFAWDGDDDPLRLGLADTCTGVGFYSLYGGEDLLFGTFLWHLCGQLIQIARFCSPLRDGLNLGLSYKLAPSGEGDVKYFYWNFFDWSLGQWKNASFSMKSRSCGSIR